MKSINALHMSADELFEFFGIEVAEDGSVYDPVEGKTFDTLADWKYSIEYTEQDGLYGGKKFFGGRYGFDDEY